MPTHSAKDIIALCRELFGDSLPEDVTKGVVEIDVAFDSFMNEGHTKVLLALAHDNPTAENLTNLIRYAYGAGGMEASTRALARQVGGSVQ